MEILKKTAIALYAIALSISHSSAQASDDTQKAFKASYVNEYKLNYPGAISDLTAVYKADSYELNLRLGWLNYLAKQYTTSMDFYQKAIDLKKYSIEARFGYIKPALEAKKYDKVYEAYQAILKIDPNNNTANYWIGVTNYGLKKYDAAAKYFEVVVNMYPFDYDANHMLGWSYLNLGKMNEAKALFKVALMNRPGDASATDGLSRCK